MPESKPQLALICAFSMISLLMSYATWTTAFFRHGLSEFAAKH